MKICNHCQASVEDELEVCQNCGLPLTDAEAAEEAPVTEEIEVVETAEETVTEETAEEAEAAEAPKPKKSRIGLIVGLALAAVLLVAVILLKGQTDKSVMEPGCHTNAYGYESYSTHFDAADDGSVTFSQMDENGQLGTVREADALAQMDAVIATCGDMELTNRDLAYYYEQQLYNLQATYGSYLAYFLDSTRGLDEQLSMDGAQTWQQFLVNAAVKQFMQVAAVKQTAEAEGVTLTEENLAYLEQNADFDAIAAGYGMADAQALMDAQFGPGCSPETYRAFMETVLLANTYVNSVLENMEVTQEELEAYYDANADMMTTSYGIQKIDKNVVAVRHILLQPETTTAEDGSASITEEAWAAAEKQAQEIYDQWLAGDATEESFAELANAHSTDPGSNTNGGLYEDVYPGQMVPEFNDWCFADGRQTGDHTIVKTSYGYHIMFFSAEGDYVYWEMAASDLCRQEKTMARIEEITASFETTTDMTKAMLMDPTAPTAPAEEAAPSLEDVPDLQTMPEEQPEEEPAE